MGLPAVSLISVYYLPGAAGGGVTGKLCFAHLWWMLPRTACYMSKVWMLWGLQLKHIHTGE